MKEPVEVCGAAGVDVEDEEFRDGVGVESAESGFECGKARRSGFDDKEDFRGLLDFVLPAVDGFDLGNEVDAGSEALLDEG